MCILIECVVLCPSALVFCCLYVGLHGIFESVSHRRLIYLGFYCSFISVDSVVNSDGLFEYRVATARLSPLIGETVVRNAYLMTSLDINLTVQFCERSYHFSKILFKDDVATKWAVIGWFMVLVWLCFSMERGDCGYCPRTG